VTAEQPDLAALRALDAAATPGPWHVEYPGDLDAKSAIIECVRWKGYLNPARFDDDHATAEFIAAMRNALPALLDATEGYQRLLAAYDRHGAEWEANQDAAVAARAEVAALRDGIERLEAHWVGCWCGVGPHGEQQQERDCPRHGSDDCRHMAEGIVSSLRALLGPGGE